jgi:hypothetical protein
MKIVYVNKDEFNTIVETHFNKFKNFNAVSIDDMETYGYNKLHILFNQGNTNYVLWDFVADETEEDYREHFYKFMKIKNNYIVGGYLDSYNSTMYCTDINFIVTRITDDIYENNFINYILERCNSE